MVARVVWDHEAAGSSPATPTNINMREWLSGRASPCQGERREFESRLPLQICGYGSMVERQPSKLNTRVRFPLPAPFLRL